MGLNIITGTLQRLKARVANAVAQDCPPDLAACQVCQRQQCRTEEWVRCERRLTAKRYLEAGDVLQVEKLRQAHALEAAACAKARSAPPGGA